MKVGGRSRLALGLFLGAKAKSAGFRIVATSIPVAQVGEEWTATWEVVDGVEPYTLSDSTFPAWLSTVDLVDTTITAVGTPDEFDNPPYTYDLEVTDDDSAVATKAGTITVVPADMDISGDPLDEATAESAYSDTLTVSGGYPPYTLTTFTGLPTGLSAALDTATITIDGTPGAGTDSGSPYSLSVLVTDDEGNTASLSPSLTVNAASASYTDIIAAGVLFGDGTFTRASSGTRFNSTPALVVETTDTARVDHNPSTGARLGLLIEQAATNLITDSQAFDTGGWSATGITVTANSTTAPDGASTADTLTTTTTIFARVQDGGINVSSGVQCIYVYAKAGTASWIKVEAQLFDITAGAWFNLGAGSVGTSESGITARIQALANGWYRCSIVFTTTSDLSGTARLLVTDGDNTSVVTNGVYLYTWQCDFVTLAASASSAIPTTGSTATRAADVCTVLDLTDIAHSATVGTVLVEAVAPPSVANASTIWSLNDNTANEVIRLHMEAGGALKAQVIDGGSTVADINIGTLTARQSFKAAMSYAANDIKACLNGGTVGTDASASLPTVDRMFVGRGVSGSYWNAWVDALRYYPSAEDTQALTT